MTDAIKRSFPPVVDRHVRLLVLGSLPGERSLAERRYYAHPQNQFWSLMSHVLDHDLVGLDYEDRLRALLARRVGLWDVVATARRRGSSDAAIRDPAANDVSGLIAQLPELRAVALNGATALRHGAGQIGTTNVAVVALPSSSPLHTVGRAAKQPAWDQLREYL